MNKERNNKLLKVIDRYIGIPLVYLLGLKNKKSNTPKVINNLGILATAAIGDTLIMSGAINSIKKKYPKINITLFCGSSNYEISKLLNNVDKVEQLSIKNVLQSKNIIQQSYYDVWIDFGPWPRLNSILTNFAKSNYKIGFKTKGQYRHFVYDKWIEHSDILHEYENYCNLIKLVNVYEFEKPNLYLNESNENIENDYVVFHLFAGGSKANLKHLPLKKWKELAKYLFNQEYKVYLTGAPNDYKQLENFIDYTNLSIMNMAGKLSLKETAQLLKKSKLVISIDTGIMHLASVLNTPLIAIHGPTKPSRWGPLSSNSYSIYLDMLCSPCISLGFESKCVDNICMQSIKTSDIINIIENNNLL